MKRTGIVSLIAVLLGGVLLFPAVRQVRVTAQRAAIYAEPDRASTRIDIVQKGALLNLFQQQKVKGIWYYVSYVSPRYGGRMSGFILDSAVEPVQEGAPAGEKPVVPAPQLEKPPAGTTPRAPAVSQKPVAVEGAAVPKKKTEPEPPAKPDIAKEMPKPPEVSVVTAITRLPRSKRIALPRRAAGPVDIPWDILEPPAPPPVKPPDIITAPTPAVAPKTVASKVPPKAKPKIAEVSVVTMVTRAPRANRVSLPRRLAVLQDMPWATIQPPAPEPQPKVIAAAPTPPAPAKVDTSKPKTRIEPTEEVKKSPPVAPQAKPPQPVRVPGAGRRSPRLGINLGFGPSFGGAGGSLQVFLGRGLALHGGCGVYPTTVVYSETDWVKNETLWSAGLKIYPVPSSEKIAPYIDAQYGGFMVEAAQVITGIYDYSFVYNLEQKALWGPSLLAGLEIRFGRFALSGGVGASYSLTDWDVLESRVFFAFEAGLGVRL